MALRKRLEFSTGLVLPYAYIKVATISGSKYSTNILTQVYVSQELYSQGKDAISGGSYTFTPSVEADAPNTIAQAYDYLRTHKDFEGAEDV